jgi:hypothetical protein
MGVTYKAIDINLSRFVNPLPGDLSNPATKFPAIPRVASGPRAGTPPSGVRFDYVAAVRERPDKGGGDAKGKG